jgi:hypothetical protein
MNLLGKIKSRTTRARLVAQTLQSLTMANFRLRELGYAEDARVVKEIHDRLQEAYMRNAA